MLLLSLDVAADIGADDVDTAWRGDDRGEKADGQRPEMRRAGGGGAGTRVHGGTSPPVDGPRGRRGLRGDELAAGGGLDPPQLRGEDYEGGGASARQDARSHQA